MFLIGVGIAILGAGPARGRDRLPFGGAFGPQPLGMSPRAWLGAALALAATYAILQAYRGNFDVDDDREDKTITLGLNAPPESDADDSRAAR